MRFKIIIPNFNNAVWLDQCLKSVMEQTHKDYACVVVDDCSTDDSVPIIKQYPVDLIQLKVKHWNGGARNVGIHYNIESDYTLFLDSDDWLLHPRCLEKINTILEEKNPDCLSLSFQYLRGSGKSNQLLLRNTQRELVDSIFVACWTKVIRTELIQLFPENTLMEDVVQHIKQCDVLNSFASMAEPVICWNRNNENSVSRGSLKWDSSMFRYVADLMDLEVKSECVEQHRLWRLEMAKQNIVKGIVYQ